MPKTENPAEPLPADIQQDASVETLDVRGLEPPEPMVRTLEALQHLPVGKTLQHVNVRVPRLLLPKLTERGFSYEMREHSPDLVLVFIRRPT
jgi:tRNA 2-thiouridine synthesizing protein A